MRRRRNADALPSTDETGNNSEAELTEPSPETVTAAAPAAAETPTEAPARKPRRRSTAAAKAAAEEPAAPAAAAETPPPAEPAAEEKPKRAPRRRGAKAEAAAADAAAAEPSPSPEVPAAPATVEAETPTAAAAEEAAPTAGRRRSRSRRGGGAAARTAAAAAPQPAETDVPDAVAVTGDPEEVAASSEGAGEESGRPRRTRGLRRRPAEGAQFVAAPTLAADIEPAAPVIEPAEEGAETETGRPKRTRGLRRRGAAATTTARGEAPAAAPVPTIVLGPPPEPIPPPYQPLPREVLERLPEVKVAVRLGVPELLVNGEPRLPLWFFVNTEAAEDPEAGQAVAVREIRMAYEAGIRTFTVLAHLPWRTRSGERRYDVLDDALQLVADNAPDALILPRLIFSPPASWERAHPEEMTAYPDGERGDVSIASRAFWEGEADEALRAAVEHVAQGPHAGRVAGFYLEHGEWLYEKGRGYDGSAANRNGFRNWLRQRYRRDLVSLRAAWHDGAVTFDNAEIPSWPPPLGSTLFYGPREQRWVDFHEYSSDVVAQVILRLGKAVKEASGGRSAVAVSYGYTLELPRAYSGHLALGQVLASPNVDILTGPVSYSGRTPGGSATFPAPIDSVTLAGKLWISEDDTKTYLASDQTPDTYNPKIATLEGTRSVQARNFGAALARGAGVSWMDLWGEGWLDDREIWQGIAYLRSLADANAARRRAPEAIPLPPPDVAVIVDERSFFGVRADEFLLGHLVSQQRDALLRSGARVGFYLLSDLLKKEFPRSAKLLLFLNAYRIPGNVRAAIRDRFQDDGRTLAWVFAPGALEQSAGIGDVAAAAQDLTEVIGMQVRQQPWGSKAGTQILSSVRSPLTDPLRGQKFGEEARFNPTYAVTDPKATVLGEYAVTGNASIAVRKHARWQSVFFGDPATLSVPLLRGLYRLAGVPVYTVDDDAVWLGDRIAAVHSAPGGGTTFFQPDEGALMDLLTGEPITSGGWGARLSMPPRGTRLLFHGTAHDLDRFRGDVSLAPLGLSEEELPPPPPAFAFEAEPAAPGRGRAAGGGRGASRRGAAAPTADIDPEDAALFEAALQGEFPFEGEDDAGEAAEAVGAIAAAAGAAEGADGGEAGRKKRRRRRRGRGRGQGETAEGGEELAAEPGAAADDESEDESYDGETPGAVLFDVATETLIAAPAAPPQRPRPSLEELLPHSDLPDGGELPPIPDELLPLSDDEFAIAAAAPADAAAPGTAEGDAAAADQRTPRRSRRGGTRYRRGRRAGEEGGEGDGTAGEPAAE